jgi:hypothetical protein
MESFVAARQKLPVPQAAAWLASSLAMILQE